MPIQPDPSHQPLRRGANPTATLDGPPPEPVGDDEPVALVPPPDVDDLTPTQLRELLGDEAVESAEARSAAVAGEALATAEQAPELVARYPELERADRYRQLAEVVLTERAAENAARQAAAAIATRRKAAEAELGEFAREGYGDPAGILKGTGIKVTNRTRRRSAS
jgi:hypothetical protein